jgi:electron transfer flavoprotein beta subunit
MELVAILSGVLDYKRPLETPRSGNWIDILDTPTVPYRLSPFDEAALETALKLRESGSASHLTVVVTHGSGDTNLLRQVAAYKPDRIRALNPTLSMRMNAGWLCKAIAEQLQDIHKTTDLWLVGREHGDLDDGAVPPYLAKCLDLVFINEGLTVQRLNDGSIEIESIRSGALRTTQISNKPSMISVTNDKRNRLRHPLMKNVALAKQLRFEVEQLSLSNTDKTNETKVLEMLPSPARLNRETPCQTIEGDDHQKARELLDWLMHEMVGKR